MKPLSNYLNFNNYSDYNLYEGLLPNNNKVADDYFKSHIKLSNPNNLTIRNKNVIINTETDLMAIGFESMSFCDSCEAHVEFKDIQSSKPLDEMFKNLTFINNKKISIYFNNCELTDSHIKELNKFEQIATIYITGGNSLKTLSSNFKTIKYIYIENCNSLKTVSNLKNFYEMYVYNCNSLENVSNIYSKFSVNFANCNSLKTVSNITSGGPVSIFKCRGVETVSNIKTTEHIDITGCVSLKTVSGCDKKVLTIDNCENKYEIK